jgi:O-antigen/teichoic acid export membrane protein
MRTGANVALQGLNTIVNPLLPDLMRFLHAREQSRTESAIATICILVIAVMAPSVVVLQAFIEPLYLIWTQNKVSFNPVLFAFLSFGILVYAVMQPATAVVMGNNLTKAQLALTAVAAIIVFAVLVSTVPILGIVGAGIALLLAEICAAVGYKKYAKEWLKQNGLRWPSRAFHSALTALVIAAISLAGLILAPQFKWIFCFNVLVRLECPEVLEATSSDCKTEFKKYSHENTRCRDNTHADSSQTVSEDFVKKYPRENVCRYRNCSKHEL